MTRKIIVLGAGFSGLSAAAYLSRQGFQVEILEKNAQPGGRAGKIEADGFTFDLGPTWYWMPEVFDRFFAHFDSHPSNYYDLVKLDPAFRIINVGEEPIDVPSSTEGIYSLFESIEPGSSKKLKRFLNQAQQHYRLVMNKLMYKSGHSISEYLTPSILFNLLKNQSFRSFSRSYGNLFKDPRLKQIVEYPLLFMGAKPSRTPSLFNLINHANLELGSWYPMGGMHKVAEAMEKICYDFDVDITYNVDVDQLDVLKDKVNSAHFSHRNFYGEYFVSSADYHYTDKVLLSDSHSNYTEKNWKNKVLGPSALLFFLGTNKKIDGLLHHNLFVDVDFDKQLLSSSKTPKWPEKPAFFVTVPSKTDPSVAPKGGENLIVMIPLPSGLDDQGKVRDHYYNLILDRMEAETKCDIRQHIVYHKSYAHTDFINDYNAYKGNAYGLANMFSQLGPFRAKMANRNLQNLFYTGHYTLPGPGIPPAIISGEIVAREIYKHSGGRKS